MYKFNAITVKENPRKLISKADITIQRFTQKCQELIYYN